ncbi:uncharacterized protein LOC144443981 [Glandiceps talaboti]
MRQQMKEIQWDQELNDKVTDEAWNLFMYHLNKSIKSCIPRTKPKNTSSHNKPVWFNGTARDKVKEKHRAFKKYITTRDGEDYRVFAKARNQAKWACRQAVRDFERNIAHEVKLNPKVFYKYANSRMKTKESIGNINTAKGIVSSDNEKAEELNNFFCSVFTKENFSSVPNVPDKLLNTRLTDIHFTQDTIYKELIKLNSSKAAGPDGLHPRILKELANEISYPLYMIFKSSLDSAIDENKPVDVVYLDFAKAFDTVPHTRLLIKLKAYGIDGKVLTWINSFLSIRKQRVIVNGSKSEWSQVLSGIPQGSVLGPALFICFINDLPDSIMHSICLMFADDTKVYRTVESVQDCQLLQEDIDNLTDWSDLWQLKFNATKCKIMHIGYTNTNTEYTMNSNNVQEPLQVTELEKDLGVHVDPELKFSSHVENEVNKANQILGLIRRSFIYLEEESLKKLFIALVRPHLEYANTVWSPRFIKDINLIESVQRRATKLLAKLRNLDYEDRLAYLDLHSMVYRRARGDMIALWKYTHGKYNANHHFLQLDTTGVTRGHPLKLKKFGFSKSVRAHFFGNRVINTWNSLPATLVTSNSLNCFKNNLDSVWEHWKYSTNIDFSLRP